VRRYHVFYGHGQHFWLDDKYLPAPLCPFLSDEEVARLRFTIFKDYSEIDLLDSIIQSDAFKISLRWILTGRVA